MVDDDDNDDKRRKRRWRRWRDETGERERVGVGVEEDDGKVKRLLKGQKKRR